jgi:hypothetical protein
MNKLFALLFLLVSSNVFAATSRTRTDEVVDQNGGSVYFPAGLELPTASAQNGQLYYGAASLTLTAGTNVAAVVTPVSLEYYTIGTQVCAYGQVSIDPTASATASTFTLSLPVTRSANFSGTSGAAGHAGILGAAVGSCLATTAAKTVTCNYVSGGTAVELVPVQFCYATTGH